MEVLHDNYLEVLPQVLSKLREATFVSFDAEYTGLKAEAGDSTSLFDNVAERYSKLRSVVLHNSAPQFGLSIFKRIEPEDKSLSSSTSLKEHQYYAVEAYSFYLSEPSFANFNMTTTTASVDIDCCQFLRGINFNFNKWFLQSVPYLNVTRTQQLVEYLDAHPDFIDEMRAQEQYVDPIFFPPELEHLKKDKGVDEFKKEVVRRLRGFSAVVDLISELQVPVVGHNMVLDLMYFFHQFCDDLPEQYSEFKAAVGEFLPIVYDTKYMTIRCRKMLDHPSLKHTQKDKTRLQCSGLYIIYNTSSAVVDKFSPKVVLGKSCTNFGEELERGKRVNLEGDDNVEGDYEGNLCHQPSFDACVTGLVFLNLAHIACRMNKEMEKSEAAPSMEEVMFSVRHWQDQVFIARATVMTMCLKGDDPRPNRTWLKVTKEGGRGNVEEEQLIELLKKSGIGGGGGLGNKAEKKEEQLRTYLTGVDFLQVSHREVQLAVARAQNAKEIEGFLTGLGYCVKKMVIPWDKKRLEGVDENLKMDPIYDTGPSKFM